MKNQIIHVIRKLQNTKVILMLLLLAGLIINLVFYFYYFQSQQNEYDLTMKQLDQLEHDIRRLSSMPDGKRVSMEEARKLLQQVPPTPGLSNILIPLSRAEMSSGATIEHIQAETLGPAADQEDKQLEKYRYRLELSGTFNQMMAFLKEVSAIEVMTEVDRISLQLLSENDQGPDLMMANLSLITFHAAQFGEYAEQQRSIWREANEPSS